MQRCDCDVLEGAGGTGGRGMVGGTGPSFFKIWDLGGSGWLPSAANPESPSHLPPFRVWSRAGATSLHPAEQVK